MSDTTKRLTEKEYIEAIILHLYRSDIPMRMIKEIAEAVGVSQVTIPKYLNLIVNKLVKLHPSGTTKQYFLTDEGRKKAEEILEKRKAGEK